jgi:hypothetical protein
MRNDTIISGNTVETFSPDAIRAEELEVVWKKKPSLAANGPTSARLEELAKTRRPPQSWYDETTDPTSPQNG